MNSFFFSDETMHKVYKDKNLYNIFYQIPIILYSTLICTIINIILKHLSLSENSIISLNNEKTYKNAIKKSEIILKSLKTKFIFFLLLSLIILLFCLYFISCFCAVYINTQLILLIDTIISFVLSMLYPFGLNLFPSLLRILSLGNVNKDRKCMYKISKILALF